MTAAGTRRLFFALWPDERMRAEIVLRRQQLKGLSPREVPDHNLHLTLLFLGDQPEQLLGRIFEAVGQIQSPTFDLLMDRFGWFRQARVAWLGGPAEPKGQTLVDALATRMSALKLDFRAPTWSPHVTLFRAVSRNPSWPAVAAFRWLATSFALVESVRGRPYQVLRTWPLE